MPEQESLEQRLIALQESLESRLAAVEAENATLRAQLAERTSNDTSARPAARKAARTLSRRKALARLGGAAAAAGVAATAASLATNAPTAHAADGGAVLLGQANTSTNLTTIANDGTATINSTLQVTATYNSGASTGSLTAIEAVGPIAGVGVYGEADWLGGSPSAGLVGASYQQSSSLAHRGPHHSARGNSGTGPFPIAGVAGFFDGTAGFVNLGAGVVGEAIYGTGVAARSSYGIDLYLWGTGRIHQNETIFHAGPPAAADGTFDVSEQIRDSRAMVWFSMSDPSNNLRWVRPGVVNGAALGGAMNFLPSPVRAIGTGSPPGIALGKNTHTNFTLAGFAGIPTDATAVFGNATVLGAGGSGFVTLTPQGGSASTSSLNFTGSDQPLSNFVAVGLNAGTITVTVSNNFNVKFIYDVVGYCL